MIVEPPLNSLMEDQVLSLKSNGISTALRSPGCTKCKVIRASHWHCNALVNTLNNLTISDGEKKRI